MSYESPNPSCPAWIPPKEVNWHSHSRKEFLRHVQESLRHAMKEGKPSSNLKQQLLLWATDAKMLRDAWEQLSRRGGHAPGPDNRRYTDYDDQEVWSLLTTVSKALRDGSFRRGKVRPKSVLKDILNPERGTRTISLLSIVDRVVQRAIYNVLEPLVDPLLGKKELEVGNGERVFGFRRSRGRLHALAVAEYLIAHEGRMYWGSEDLKNAFDNVPHAQLRDVLMVHVPCEKLVGLILDLVVTGKKNGIQQGGPLSPLLLNLYLHHFLDRVWAKQHPDIPLVRYADDLLILSCSRKEATAARAALKHILLPTGMSLKLQTAKAAIRKITTDPGVKWLGFQLHWSGARLQVTFPDKALERLGARLSLAHDSPNSPIKAIAMIKGWLAQMGPCYDHSQTKEILKQLRSTATDVGFDEIPRIKLLQKWWSDSRDDLTELRKQLTSFPVLQSSPPTSVDSGMSDIVVPNNSLPEAT